MSVKLRFAPSPTGFLHVGNIRAAIINYLYCQKHNGEFILRLDDTDISRCTNEYRDGIIEDMNWLGLHYSNNQPLKQSDRLDVYEEAKQKLIKSGRLYECYETEEELHFQRSIQMKGGQRPIYNRAALNLTEEQKENYRAQGLKPHYRFLLEDKEISWQDKIKGKVSFGGRHFSDPIIVRDNGAPTYTFCSVVDDIDFGITDIVRGEDHITNTAIQIQIFTALGGAVPHFSHLALIKANAGKISKRVGGFDIKTLRNDGFEPLAIINLLAQIGTSNNVNIYDDIAKLVADFSLSKFSKSATNYDLDELSNINQKLLRNTSLTQAKARLHQIGLDEIANKIDDNFWNSVRPNINFLKDVEQWWHICKENLQHQHNPGDLEFLQLAKAALPEDTSQEDSWNIWLNAIKEKTDRKGKPLFMPLRLALTGQEHGPELKTILPLIDRNEIISRLSQHS
ncbi:MAG: glutamate--tRNA ligase [Proteobacteria bacterium]|nr:glutamate--tRNA ligase [Pseudomonadota bacterium]